LSQVPNTGGSNGSDGDNTAEPGTAGGAAGDYRVGGGGGAGHGRARPDDGSGASDRPDRADGGGGGDELGRNDFHYWEQEFRPGAGEPEEGSREWYRQQPAETREVNLEHASTLTEDFIRATAHAPEGDLLVEQLAADLSGRYGRYLIAFRGSHAFPWLPDGVELYGEISGGGQEIGRLQISCSLDEQRGLVVAMGVEDMNGKPALDRAQLYSVLRDVLGPYFARSHVVGIEGPFLSADTADAVAGIAHTDEPAAGSREWYRLQNVDTRAVNPEHANTLADVDAAAPAAYGVLARQLADDLSGRYGKYLVKFHGSPWPNGVVNLYGRISQGGEEVGRVQIRTELDEQLRYVVSLGVEGIDGGPVAQVYTVLDDTLRPYLERSDVFRIEGPFLATHDTAGTVAGPSEAGEPTEGSREWYRPNGGLGASVKTET
jgi:hypothetical protein